MTKLHVTAEPNSHAVHMTRDFNAPRALVFRAFTDPALVAEWWGQESTTTIVDQMDVKMGGVWRYVQRGADGSEYGFRGVYHEISAPARIVYTFEFEGMPGHIMLETISFEEHDGVTTVTDSAVFQTIEDRDGMIASGMEGGATESWDRLERLLKTL